MSETHTETDKNRCTKKWRNYRKWAGALCLFFFTALVLGNSSQASAGTAVKAGDLKYTVNEKNKTAQCTGKAEKTENYIVIPAEITVKGKTYKVTSIKDNAFKNDAYLLDLAVGKNVKKIGKNACAGCSSLELLIIETKKLTAGSVGASAFKNAGTNEFGENLDVNVPEKKLPAYEKILRKRGMTETYQIFTTNIGKLSYAVTDEAEKKVQCTGTAPGRTGFSSITIPDTVTINGRTYSVTRIGSVSDGYASIRGGNRLKKIIIGSSVEEIDCAAFGKFQSIEELTIGKNVQSIGGLAFYACYGLKKLTIKTNKLTAESIGENAFELINPGVHIYVPESREDAWRKLLQENGVSKKDQRLNGKSLECYSYSDPEYAFFSLGKINSDKKELLETDSSAYSIGGAIPFSMRFVM